MATFIHTLSDQIELSVEYRFCETSDDLMDDHESCIIIDEILYNGVDIADLIIYFDPTIPVQIEQDIVSNICDLDGFFPEDEDYDT